MSSRPSSLVSFVLLLAFLFLAACSSSSSRKAGAGETAETGHTRQKLPAGEMERYQEQIRGSKQRFAMQWIQEGGFWIGVNEVTWDEYLLYCDFEKSGKVPPLADAVTKPSKPQEDVAPYDREWGTGRRPAVGMSKTAAQRYCEWLSKNTGHAFRLPTEKEWRLACGPMPKGPIGEYAWHAKNSDLKTHEVGLKKPTLHGLHDMFGNLWEYCLDPWTAKEPKRAKLVGGAWSTQPSGFSSTSRLAFDPDWVLADPNVPPGRWWVPDGDHLGFRVIRTVEPKR